MARELAPERATILRACAADAGVLALIPDEPTWDVPHRVLAAIDYLVLAGEAEYAGAEEFVAAVHEHRDFVRAFVAEQPIQTNEVQRCWALLPLFLSVARAARRPLDLLELGPSAGLNLLWDRYRYDYDGATWGRPDAPLLLRGVLRRAFPLDLLEVEVEVRRRRGVDLQPVDVTTDEGVRLLWSFTVDPDRRARIERAAAAAREDPPELVRGDYVELLPELLADRDPDNLTVVFQTISTIYLPVEQRSRVATAIDRAAEGGPLAWISTPTPEEHRLSGVQYPLELGIWPEGRRRLVGEMDNGGTWLDWWA